MTARPTVSVISSRVIRPGQPVPPDRSWLQAPLGARLSAAWELFRTCFEWHLGVGNEPRLQRSVSTIQRPRVDYLVVGGYAVAAHGHVRATKDLDVWVRPSPVNAPHVIRALVEFGAPLHDLTEADLSSPGIVFQIGVPPIRIDVLTSISAVEFEPAWLARVEVDLGALKVPVLSRQHLIRNKRAVARLQDLADAERLEELHQEPSEE